MNLKALHLLPDGTWERIVIRSICAGVDLAETQVTYTVDADGSKALRCEGLYRHTPTGHIYAFRLR